MAFSTGLLVFPARSPVCRARRAWLIAATTLALCGAISAPVALAQASPTVSGNWQLTCTMHRGRVRQIPLEIAQSGSKLRGSYAGPRGTGELTGSVQGNGVSFELAQGRRAASFTGTIDGNTMKVHTPKGITCSATRE
jgi:hypothetical protein